jgi:tetratricopeptide (TPR) repeat protein
MAHDVFISYSHHDKAGADTVCAKLEQHQVRCWIAPRDVVPGAEWAESIIHALDHTRVMVLVFSSKANESPQIRKEVERAVNKGVIIVPLRIEDVVPTHALEYFMSDVHWLDALTPPLEKHLDHLAGTVKMLLERAGTGDVDEKYRGIRPGAVPESSRKKEDRWLGLVPWAQHRRYLSGLAISLMAVAGSLLSWRYFHPPLRIPRVAVIGPTNSSGSSKYDYLSTQVGDIVSVDLSQASKLNPVPREDIVHDQEDISIPADPCSGNVHPAPMQNVVAASYLIFGSFRQNTDPQAGSIHIMLCLLDPNGRVLGTFEQDRNEDTMGEFAELAADHFRKIINATNLVPQDFGDVFPRDRKASALYFEGVGDMRSFNAAKARDALQTAARNEDSSPMIHAALAQAWSMLREDAKAKDEANLARSLLPGDFPLEYGVLIQADAAEMNQQWDTALGFYTSLYKSSPERLDYGLKVASVQIKASQLGPALATLRGLADLPRPLGQDPRIHIEQSKALIAHADFRGGIQAADTARTMAKEKKLLVIQANADLQLCWAYQRAGEIDKASSACNEAQQTFRTFNDDVSAAVALNDIATWLTERDDRYYDEAKHDYDEVIAIHENAHDQKDLAGALINRAKVSILQGHLTEAETDLKRARDIARSIPDDTDDEAIALINLANISRQRGQMEDVVKQASYARDLAHSVPDPDVEATALSALALAETETGDLSKALKDNESLLKMRTDPAQIATTLSRIGEIYLRIGDLPDARKSFQDALDRFASVQKPDDAAQALLDLSEVDLDAGHFASAEEKARRALQAFVEQNDQDSQADALASLLRALVGQGAARFPEAEDRLKTLRSVKFADPEVGFDVALSEGTVLVATGNTKDALGILSTASSDAAALGLQFTALQLELAAVPAIEKSGDHAGARKALAHVRASARRLGFKLISTEAEDTALSSGL